MKPTYIKIKCLIFSARYRLNQTKVDDLTKTTPVYLGHEVEQYKKKMTREVRVGIITGFLIGFAAGLSFAF